MSLWNALRGKEKLTGQHLLIIASVVIFSFVFTTWSVGYTSKSNFCGTCHEMSTLHQTWASSSHKNIACIECHSEPGVRGMVKAKANGLRELYIHVTSSEFKPKAEAKDINCLSCHQDKVSTNVDRALATKNPHTIKHFDNGMTCISCHTGLVHNAKLNTTVPGRELCVTCHLDMNK